MTLYNDALKRTTIMAEEELLARLRAIARSEGVSLAEVIRQGLELRASGGRRFGFVGAIRSQEPTAIVDVDNMQPEPQPWR
ncbi:MAG: CopG family transcriptional regulator [Actinomycetota bacterium]